MKRVSVDVVLCFGNMTWDAIPYDFPASELDPEGAALDQAAKDFEGMGVAYMFVACVYEQGALDEMLATLLAEGDAAIEAAFEKGE